MNETRSSTKKNSDKASAITEAACYSAKRKWRLKEELDSTKKEVSVQQESLENLKQQVDVLKYSNGEMSEADKKEFEKKINCYVKEIDRCIAMLSQ